MVHGYAWYYLLRDPILLTQRNREAEGALCPAWQLIATDDVGPARPWWSRLPKCVCVKTHVMCAMNKYVMVYREGLVRVITLLELGLQIRMFLGRFSELWIDCIDGGLDL